MKDKIKVLHSLILKADVVCIGGRMAFTFLAAEGVAVGRTQIEEDWLEVGGGLGCVRSERSERRSQRVKGQHAQAAAAAKQTTQHA